MTGVALALGSSTARADWLSTGEARYVTGLVVQHRYRSDGFAYGGGVAECTRRSAQQVRCDAFLLTYRGGSNVSKHECDWPTYVVRRGGQLGYRLGPTHCHPVV